MVTARDTSPGRQITNRNGKIDLFTFYDDPHAYKLNYLEGVGYHSIISRGGKSGDMYNEFIVKYFLLA